MRLFSNTFPWLVEHYSILHLVIIGIEDIFGLIVRHDTLSPLKQHTLVYIIVHFFATAYSQTGEIYFYDRDFYISEPDLSKHGSSYFILVGLWWY